MATQGLDQVRVAMRSVHVDTAREFEGELDRCAEIVARRMRRNAPKHRSQLALSVRTARVDMYTRDIGPTAAHAAPQEEGVRPGGKGLPRFGDPAGADILAWLKDKAFRAAGRMRRASASGALQALELRDRYEGLARHIRRHGVKASPFILRSLHESEAEIRARLQAAGERVLARAGSTGGAA